MTSATLRRDSGAGGRHAVGQGFGMVVFASVLMLIIGFFNMLFGISAIANSHVFVANAHYVVGDLRAWGWATLIIAVLQLIAAGGVLMGNQLARWFAVAVIGISAIEMMFFLPGLPVLGAGHHRRGRRGVVGAVRVRQPGEPGRRLGAALGEESGGPGRPASSDGTCSITRRTRAGLSPGSHLAPGQAGTFGPNHPGGPPATVGVTQQRTAA